MKRFRIQSCVLIILISALVAPCATLAWDSEIVDNGGDVGKSTSLALDSSGNPRISYYDDTNNDLKYAAWNGASWSISTIDSSGYVGYYTSLALDSSDRPRISYYDDTNNDLKYAVWNGASWSISTVDSCGTVGAFTSLALDSNGYPRISYYDQTNDDLKYAAGKPDTIGILRSGLWGLDYNGNFAWDASDKAFNLGQTGDVPVMGRWS